MAWSDEARAAAAEARKMHAKSSGTAHPSHANPSNTSRLVGNKKLGFAAVRRSTNQIYHFASEQEATRFAMRRGDQNELWRVVKRK